MANFQIFKCCFFMTYTQDKLGLKLVTNWTIYSWLWVQTQDIATYMLKHAIESSFSVSQWYPQISLPIFLPKFSILWNWHWLFLVPSRPDGNYNSNTGTAGCIPDFVMIPGSSNFGNEDGTCLTPGNTAQVTIDRSVGLVDEFQK